MSAFSYVTIWCDGEAGVPQSCGEVVHGATVAAARDFAARQGWQTDGEGRLDFCPEHAKVLLVEVEDGLPTIHFLSDQTVHVAPQHRPKKENASA